MADLKYDFLDNNFFLVYLNVETPKVTLDLPLFDSPVDISDWASGISSSGVPIVKNADENFPKLIVDNNPEEELYLEEKLNEPKSEEITTQKPSKKINQSEKALRALEFFINKGLLRHLAAGIVGNLIHESNLNTTVKGDGGKAFGIALWHPDRQKGLLQLAKLRGVDVSDFDTQLEYVWLELNSRFYKKALDGILNSRNVEQATNSFMLHFERPGKPMLANRIKLASSLL